MKKRRPFFAWDLRKPRFVSTNYPERALSLSLFRFLGKCNVMLCDAISGDFWVVLSLLFPREVWVEEELLGHWLEGRNFRDTFSDVLLTNGDPTRGFLWWRGGKWLHVSVIQGWVKRKACPFLYSSNYGILVHM